MRPIILAPRHVNRRARHSAFDPSRSTPSPHNPVLLPLDKVTEYIKDGLIAGALGLRTDARTSFTTLWLPILQKHAFIALRSVPRGQYEAAVPLHVTPSPQVMVRVFMLLKSAKEAELEMWEST